jgi:hypothetical protein
MSNLSCTKAGGDVGEGDDDEHQREPDEGDEEKERRNRHARMISATERAPWRTDATSVEKSCTAPMKMAPRRIQSSPGSHPNSSPAMMGPTIGPAAEIALKCCASSGNGRAGTKSTPSSHVTAGVGRNGSSANRRAIRRP